VASSGGYSGLWESNNGIDWEETKVTPNRTVERTLWSDLAVKDNIFIAVGHMPYADENTYYRSTEPGGWK
jgi:hypothetical protein